MITLSIVARYIELGFVVHPCCPPTHRCQSPGKIPFDPVEGKHMAGWQKHEQFSPEWWQERIDYDSEINIGFLCGSPSGVVCLDVDEEEGKKVLEDAGINNYQATWLYTTGRGFRSLYRHREGPAPSELITRGDHSVEVLGDGRQSVLPPSLHPNGRNYRWVSGNSPKDCELLDSAYWAADLSRAAGGITSDREDWVKTVEFGAAKGSRNITMTRLAGHLMNPCPMPTEEAYMWLRLFNEKHCSPPLSDREIKSIVRSIRGREEERQTERELEIKAIAKRERVSYEDAELIWRSLGGVG